MSEPLQLSTDLAAKIRLHAKGQDPVAFLEARFAHDPDSEITTLDDLAAVAMAPRERKFSIHSKVFKCEVRGLTGKESAEVDKIDQGIIAPKDSKSGMPNEEDPSYKAAINEARRLKRAMAISIAIPSLKLKEKGPTAREQAEWLYSSLPPGVIDEMWQAVFELTADPVQNAIFT